MNSVFQLNPALDAQTLAHNFASMRAVSITEFLSVGSAQILAAALAESNDWRWVINAGDNVYDLGQETRYKMSEEQHRELDRRISEAARDGFQFRFSSIRVPDTLDQRAPDKDPLHEFAEFMRSDAVLELLSSITEQHDICFADAQATAYHHGDFLTGHDDDVQGKNRKIAYVLGLTPQWRAEWGGLLQFHHSDGRISAIIPQFNCLNLFAVPQTHSVSQVASFAGRVRYSVTGWLRSAMPDGN